MTSRLLSSCSLIHNGSNKSTLVPNNSLLCSSLYATHMLEAVKRTKIKEVILQFAPHTEELQRQKTETNKMCVTTLQSYIGRIDAFSLVQGSREEEEVSLYLCILLHESFFSCSRSWPKMFIGKTRQ